MFVDVTADWCITCIANETAVLNTAEMTRAFADQGVVYMVADWTNQDAAIAALLQQARAQRHSAVPGVPAGFVIPPLILPQVLTKIPYWRPCNRFLAKARCYRPF
ncbi:MAG: thioredoxin family protein [Haliea sp.]|nr:thioredoxin family protein [Haliea sp.]